MKYPLVAILVCLWATLSTLADNTNTNVTLHIDDVSFERTKSIGAKGIYSNVCFVTCTATVDNQTGSALTVMAYRSPLDRSRVEVSDLTGNTFSDFDYTQYLSSWPQPFSLPVGTSTNIARYGAVYVPEKTQSARVRLIVNLEQADHWLSVTSNVVEVKSLQYCELPPPKSTISKKPR